jgi:serine/threonine protein kinase
MTRSVSNLPLTLAAWRGYFDKTFGFINDVLPRISYGHYKFQLIVTNLQSFRSDFCANHVSAVTTRESRCLFEFFKTCAGLIACSYHYLPAKFLGYVLDKPLTQQYTELRLLWDSWACTSASLNLRQAFANSTALELAHHHDMKVLHDTIATYLPHISPPLQDVLRDKAADVELILGSLPIRPEGPSNGLLLHNEWTHVKQIGQGAYAVVWLAKMNSDRRDVAVKELKQMQLNQRNVLSLTRELNALLSLHHPNVLEFIGVTISAPFSIVTAYMASGSLYDTIRGKTGSPLHPRTKLKIAVGMARGLEYLALMKFIHRDFKSQNVLLDEDWNAVICDFGITRISGQRMTCELGTIQWTAPEIMRPADANRTYDASVDTYSFGITLWELLTLGVPYMGLRQTQAAAMVLEKNLRPQIPERTQRELATLITRCWDQDPRRRPPMGDVRRELESGRILFEGTDVQEFLQWVAATRPQHEAIINAARESATREEAIVFDQLRKINPLDPAALKLLQSLYQMEFSFSMELFKDVLRLVNQSLSLPVQDAAFDLLRKMFLKADIATADPQRLVDMMLPLFDTQPQYFINLVKLFADKLSGDIDPIIKRFLSLAQSHATVDLLQAVISPRPKAIDPRIAIRALRTLEPQFRVSFFRFLVTSFGPIAELVPVTVSSVYLIPLFIRGLARECDSDLDHVKRVLDIPDVRGDSREQLQTALEGVAAVITNPQAEVTERVGLIIMKFLVQNCVNFLNDRLLWTYAKRQQHSGLSECNAVPY